MSTNSMHHWNICSFAKELATGMGLKMLLFGNLMADVHYFCIAITMLSKQLFSLEQFLIHSPPTLSFALDHGFWIQILLELELN